MDKETQRWLRAAVCLLTAISMPAQAASWLCLGEESAAVTHENGRVTGSTSGPNNQRFLVNERGVKFFGADEYLTNACAMTPNGEPAQCADEAGLYKFTGFSSDVFVLSGVGPAGDGGFTHWIIAGTCERLDASPEGDD